MGILYQEEQFVMLYTKEAFNGISAANVAMHNRWEGVKRHQSDPALQQYSRDNHVVYQYPHRANDHFHLAVRDGSQLANEQETNTYERVKAYLVCPLEASVREIADALVMSPSTAHKWRNRVKGMRIASQ